jgi:mannosyltransferase
MSTMPRPHATPADARSPARRAGRPIDPYRAAAWGILALAVAWRLGGLDARSLWFDESFSWQLVQFPWGEMIGRAQADVHPPLYYLILKPWVEAFGDSALALRLLSVAWFGVVLAGSYLVCRESAATGTVAPPSEAGPERARARDAGLIAMLLLATSPFLFHYSQEARMYTQLIGLSLLSTWLLLRALRARARPAPWWGAYALAAAGVAYTHYFGLFAIAAQAAFCIGLILANSGARGLLPWANPTTGRALRAAALAIVLFLPWAPTFRRQQDRVAKDYWAGSIETETPLSISFWEEMTLACIIHNKADAGLPYRADLPMASRIGDLLMAAIVLLLGMLGFQGGRVGWCLVAGVVVPINLAIFSCLQSERNIINTRYLMSSYTLLLIGLALVLARIHPRWILGPIVGLIGLGQAFLTSQFTESLGLPAHSDLRGVADYIAGHDRPADVVLCLNPLDFFAAKYHARGRFRVYQARPPGLAIKHYTGGPIFQDGDFLDWEKAIEPIDRRVWVIRRKIDRPPRTPEGRRRTEHLPFAEEFRYLGEIWLDLWEPTPPARVPPAGPSPATPRGGAPPRAQ